MGVRSWQVHYMNKYPGGRVIATDSSLDVYDADGNHRVSLCKNGAGQWACASGDCGAMDGHDLSPLPKEARVHKLQKDGKIGLDEKHEERMEARKALAVKGKIEGAKA